MTRRSGGGLRSIKPVRLGSGVWVAAIWRTLAHPRLFPHNQMEVSGPACLWVTAVQKSDAAQAMLERLACPLLAPYPGGFQVQMADRFDSSIEVGNAVDRSARPAVPGNLRTSSSGRSEPL